MRPARTSAKEGNLISPICDQSSTSFSSIVCDASRVGWRQGGRRRGEREGERRVGVVVHSGTAALETPQALSVVIQKRRLRSAGTLLARSLGRFCISRIHYLLSAIRYLPHLLSN